MTDIHPSQPFATSASPAVLRQLPTLAHIQKCDVRI